MQKTPKFWQALETLRSLSQTRKEWRDLIGDEFDLLTRYMRPVKEAATAYPCPSPGGENCPRRIITRRTGEIVAVCGNNPRECATVSLTRDDIIVYEIDLSRLCVDLRVAFDLYGGKPEFLNYRQTYFLGDYRPYAGYTFPCYLTFQSTKEGMDRACDHLLSVCTTPFMLLVSGDSHCSRDVRTRLVSRNALQVALCEECACEGDGNLVLTRPRDDILSDWLPSLIPKSKEPYPMAFFPTPADATWYDVRIRFIDGHTVSVKVKKVEDVFMYMQMGMCNKKNGKPTKQWGLLATFAVERGTLTWKSRYADANNKKRKQLLADNLISFFGIDGDPFELTDDSRGWKAKFKIEADNNV